MNKYHPVPLCKRGSKNCDSREEGEELAGLVTMERLGRRYNVHTLWTVQVEKLAIIIIGENSRVNGPRTKK